MDTTDLQQLKAFFGKFKVIDVLGRGSFGVVVRAEHHQVGKCAVKLSENDRSSLKHEYEIYDHIIACELASPMPIPTIYGYGDFPDFSYLAMDLLGPSLDDLFEKLGGFSKATILQMGIQMLKCVEFLHRCGVIHGDIKGDNFAISATDPRKIVIFDFGLASKVGETCASFRGSLLYASIATHKYQPVNPKDDIESLGYLLADYYKPLPWKTAKWPENYSDQIDYGLLQKKEKNIFEMATDFFEITLFLMHVDAKANPSTKYLKKMFRYFYNN